MMDEEESRMDTDAESLPSCVPLPGAIAQSSRYHLWPLAPPLWKSPQILKDYPDLTFMK